MLILIEKLFKSWQQIIKQKIQIKPEAIKMKINTKQFLGCLLNGYNISVLVVCLLIIILPSVNDIRLVNSTITSKMIYFLYGSMILLGVYSFTIIFSKKISFSFSKIDIALFTLIFYITLNRYFIQSHYGFSIRYIELIGLSFLYIILRSISLRNYPWLLLAVVISVIIQAVYGNLQLLDYYPSNHSGFKMTGSFFNPGPYAGFLVSVWTVALGMYLFKDNITSQVQAKKTNNSPFLNTVIKYTFENIPLLGLISIAILLPALQSRASWIAAVLSSLVLLELRYSILKNVFKKVNTFKRTIAAILFVGILSAGLFGVYILKKGSSDGRAFIWKVTTEMIIDNPVFGVGFDRFNAYYMNYQAQYFEKNGETPESILADNTYYAFNEGLQFVSENGLLGLTFLLIVVHVLFQAKVNDKHRPSNFITKIGLLTIGVFACFSYPMQILPIKLVLVILLTILSNGVAETYQLNIGDNKKSQWLFKTAVLLGANITISMIFSYTKDLSQGFVTWNNALISHQYGNYKRANQEYEKAYPVFNKNGDFLMNYGKTLSMEGEPHKAIKLLKLAQHYQNNTIIATTLGDSYKATKQYRKAELAYKKAASMIPSRFYPLYLLAKLYNDSGNVFKARGMVNTILNKEVKIPSTAIKEIKIEMRKLKSTL